MFLPILNPFHRPAELHRQYHSTYLILEDCGFYSKTPSNLWGDYPDFVLWEIYSLRQKGPQNMRKLGRSINEKGIFIFVVTRENSSCLNRRGGISVANKSLRNYAVSFLEHLFGSIRLVLI